MSFRKELKLTRRNLLQIMGATVAAASVAGCSSGDDEDSVVSPMDGLVFDKEMKICFSSGAFNCGSRCVYKVYHKNGRLLKMTSAGDIPRIDSEESDESTGEFGNLMQRRACSRGYSNIQRTYQPDRVKYPMMRAKSDRGDISKFKRVDWPTAIAAVGDALHRAIQKKGDLGYSPIYMTYAGMWPNFTANPAVTPIPMIITQQSSGAQDCAKYDMVGIDAYTNNMTDRLNSKFIITWGLDPTRTTYWVEHAHWLNTKCKENPDIEIVVITPNHSDTAGMLSTGVKDYSYARADGTNFTIDIPGWIIVRPGTDGALAAAMMYVMYKNNIYDHTIVDDNTRCFGFNPGETVVSSAPVTAADTGMGFFTSQLNRHALQDYTDDAAVLHSRWEKYRGTTFTVPAGESFVEYLLSLEVSWAQVVADPASSGWKYPQPASPAIVGSPTYQTVLDYAAATCGVAPAMIEALAYKFVTTSPAFLDVGGGPNHCWNGTEWCQLMITLATMTGNIDRKGGGAGFSMTGHSDFYAARGLLLRPGYMTPDTEGMVFRKDADGNTIEPTEVDVYGGNLYFGTNEWAHAFLTGKDYRSEANFKADLLRTSKQNFANQVLRGKNMVQVDVWIMANGNHISTQENINKSLKALEKVETFVVLEQVLTPSAAYADIVLPVKTVYEKESVLFSAGGSGSGALFKGDAPLAGFELYDSKLDAQVYDMIAEYLNNAYGYNIGREVATSQEMASFVARATYETYQNPSALYKTYIDTEDRVQADTYEDFCKKGFSDYPFPKGTSFPGMKYLSIPGKLQNTTGRINIYQPLWGKVMPKKPKGYTDRWGLSYDGFRNPTACYEPLIEGWETFFDNYGDPSHPSAVDAKGRGANYGDPLRGTFTGHYSDLSKRHYKLQYITNKARNRAHSSYDNVAIIKDQFEQCVFINLIDAAERGIKHGDMVYAYNDRGCTKIPAHVSYYMPPGVISIEHASWYRASEETVHVWMDTRNDSVTGQPVFDRIPVKVDIGGAENVLTLGIGSSSPYIGQALSAHGGPCEVSLINPDKLDELEGRI
jgi:anaerobic dimethyl sulfoxide reductase subunit A